MCLPACKGTSTCSARGSQKGASDPLDLELKRATMCWELSPNLTSALNYRAVSSTPLYPVFAFEILFALIYCPSQNAVLFKDVIFCVSLATIFSVPGRILGTSLMTNTYVDGCYLLCSFHILTSCFPVIVAMRKKLWYSAQKHEIGRW